MAKKYTIVLSVIFSFLLATPLFSAVAADCSNTSQDGSVSLCNPLGSVTPQTLIGKVIGAALGIVGSLALLMFIYGGFTWMTSAGSPDKITKGKGIMVWAAIGLAVIFSSYALVKFVIDNLK